ncbi:hypothetical protein Y032_0098g3091 [Ancylostoma ceylanicum]|uniref:Uncharacterized protein n=1 Tax=Ancylostoma ceylanicum TaxID=53326 RepID=A0A016TJ44_9BILA|nr:hypothetical protein Y032_0098g3091 [Ancylostoma ceylanicum]
MLMRQISKGACNRMRIMRCERGGNRTVRLLEFYPYFYIELSLKAAPTEILAFERTPFHVHNKWSFATKAIAFLAIGFWAPFIVVEYQLRKANQ